MYDRVMANLGEKLRKIQQKTQNAYFKYRQFFSTDKLPVNKNTYRFCELTLMAQCSSKYFITFTSNIILIFHRPISSSSIELHTKTLRQRVFFAWSCVRITVRNVTANSAIYEDPMLVNKTSLLKANFTTST